MPRHSHETEIDLAPETLYRAISDVSTWPDWDPELEWVRIDGAARAGAEFALRPKGGPNVAMIVTEAESPSRFTDVARMPLARMRTSHVYSDIGGGRTRIRIEIETTGPLAWLWDRLVARKQAEGLPESTRAFVAYARRFA